MPAATTTIVRPGLVCAILAALALAPAAPAVGAAAPGGFTAPDDPGVPALISSLRGCVDRLAAPDRRVLALRAGLGGHAPELTAQVAAATGLTPAAAGTALVGAIRKLETLRRSGACVAQPAAPTSTPAPAKPAPAAAKPATTKPAKAAAGGGSSGDSTTTALEVGIPIVLVLAFLGGIGLELGRRPRESPGAPGEVEAFDPYAGDG